MLELFQTILDDRTVTSNKDPSYHDLTKLVDFILKKLFKVASEYPMLILEMFFPKSSSQLVKHRDSTLEHAGGVANPYASSDEDGLPAVLAAKGLVEVEVTPGFSLTQQIGIAMRCLTDAGQLDLIESVQRNLRLAAALRTDLVLAIDGEIDAVENEDDGTDDALRRKALRLNGPSDAAKEKFEPIKVILSSDYLKEQSSVNQHFRLLMRLLTWVSSTPGDEQPNQLEWQIPVTAMPKQLEGDLNIIEGFLIDPVDPNNGKSAADLLRRKRKPAARRRRARLGTDELDELGDASGNEEVVDENGEVTVARRSRKKATRKRKPAGAGEGASVGASGERGRARARKEKEAEAYRSAQFIEDSDFDDEADAAFFKREAELRAMMNNGQIKVAPMEGTKSGKKATPAKTKAKGKRAVASDGSEEEDAAEAAVAGSDVEMGSSDSEGEEPSAASSAEGRKRGRTGSVSTAGSSLVLAKNTLFNPSTQESQGSEDDHEEEEEGVGARGKKRKVVLDDSEEDV